MQRELKKAKYDFECEIEDMLLEWLRKHPEALYVYIDVTVHSRKDVNVSINIETQQEDDD